MINCFDYYGRYEEPTLILCNPDDTEIGVIANPENIQTNICFSDISDISYTVHCLDDVLEYEVNEIYYKHIERRQVHVAGAGYFIITDVKEYKNADGRYKEIQAKSCEHELNNINMPYISGTYKLYKTENFPEKTPMEIVSQGDEYMNENCLLYEVMKVIPTWTLEGQMELAGDTSADGAKDYSDLAETCRTFESTDVTVYSFLRNELADSYSCFVKFDIENRTIRIVKHEDVFEELPVIISDANFLNSCEVTTTIDNYVNCLKVEGTAGISINNCNPMGGSTIYNFDHDIDTGLIDGDLRDALLYWKDKLNNKLDVDIIGGNRGYYKGLLLNSGGDDCVQEWLDASSKLTKYQTSLMEAIGTGEQSKINELLNDENFLSGLGMDKNITFPVELAYNGLDKKKDFLNRIRAEAVFVTRDDGEVVEPNTGKIKNIFFEMIFERSKALKLCIANGDGETYSETSLFIRDDGSESSNITEMSKRLLVAQEFQLRLESEIKTMEKYYSGYDAQLKALETTDVADVVIPENVVEGYYKDENFYKDPTFKTLLAKDTSKIYADLNGVKLYKYIADSDSFAVFTSAELATNTEIINYNTYLSNRKGYDEQIETVTGFKNLSEEEKKLYEILLSGKTSDSDEVVTDNNVINLISDLSLFISSLQDRNGFKACFYEYLGGAYDNDGLQKDEDIAKRAEKLYYNLTRYLKQQTFTDDTIIITESMTLNEKNQQELDLYNQAVKMLEKISEPSYEITLDAETFVFLPNMLSEIRKIDKYSNEKELLKITSALHIQIPNGDIPLFHILKITTSYDDLSCEFTMGNRFRLSDPAAIFSDLQKTASSAANIVASERINWGINEEKVNELMLAKTADIDATMRGMTNSINDVSWGEFGFKCYARDENNDPSYGIWCANGVMMFTESGDEAPKMAIGRIIKADGSIEYGFNGQTIIAESITTDKFKAGSLTSGRNYVRNGSFESYQMLKTKNDGQAIKRAGIANYWERSNTDSSDDLFSILSFYDPSIASTGNRCLQLPEEMYITQTIPSINAGQYVLSFYILDGASVDVTINENFEYSCTTDDNIEIVTLGSGSRVKRCHKIIEVTDDLTNAVLKIRNRPTSGSTAYIDGVMLERGSVLREYSPYIGEVYAKYTTIDEGGVNIYNGKLTIMNNDGDKMLYADENGNLKLEGKLTAKAGSTVAGWETNDYAIYKGYTGMMSDGTYAFFAGAKNYDNIDSNGRMIPANPNFSVTHDGFLNASTANITGDIYANYLEATTGGKIANWTITKDALNGGKLVLTRNGYVTEFDGRSLRFGKAKSTGSYTESDFGSAISMMKSSNNVFNDPESDNLSIAGRTVIQFGLRGNSGSFEEVGRMYKFSYTGSNNLFNKNVLDINSVKLSNVIIGNIVYKVSVSRVTVGGISGGIGGIGGTVATSSDYFLKLDPFAGTISGLFDWVFG